MTIKVYAPDTIDTFTRLIIFIRQFTDKSASLQEGFENEVRSNKSDACDFPHCVYCLLLPDGLICRGT